MRKELCDEQSRLARPVPVSTKTEGKIRTTKLVSRKVECDQGGADELRHASSALSCSLPGSSWIHLTSFDALL